ncbi:MAG: transketolase [Opitutaceae bacterium]|nr:transketolase [Opitutaceae bacterium]
MFDVIKKKEPKVIESDSKRIPSSPVKLSVSDLEQMARQIRRDLIDMIYTANAGHPGGSLSATDIVTALYFRVMCVDPQNPRWEDRDRFILSKGHACPVWYAALANRGFFDRAHLKTLRKLNGMLQGHADMKKTPGIDMTVGSLGQGFCAGVGMALAARCLKKDFHVWAMIGDGEMQEGSIWEAAMAGAKWKLDNLTAILDKNGLQNDAFVENVMPIEPVADKWRAFGWRVLEIDGHNMQEIVEAMEQALIIRGIPTIIIAKTIKGKGVSFMENQPDWHGKAPNAEQYRQAMHELEVAV